MSPTTTTLSAAGSDHALAVAETCESILRILLPYRRAEADDTYADGEVRTAFADQLCQLREFVSAGEPIVFTLPAFPCKSPNNDKVFGHLPDLGELLSLRFLHGLTERVREVYPPGARMLICSDGHVFGDLIKVPDHHIDEYAETLRQMITWGGFDSIDTFSLENVYGQASFEEKRRILTEEFAEPEESLREEVRAGGKALRLYRGITRFLVEDAGDFEGTKSALQRECRQRAYGVIQRSRAWGDLIAKYHAKQVRLSIHPQPVGGPKFGIMLLGSPDCWLTPWHSVAVQHRGERNYTLMKRIDAAKIGEPVWLNGRPSHYVAVSA
ncbi:isocyanide synthase family protein [Crossiella sp. CA-258035]|uniref:isocyanide synthase family protein n=1 Tax=Crossiella sp. CA-258035 TaxID=2981138 RepID=UPI0024BCE330|nr:isocyanide synthase family protein [Crossiella sp. CA-258035]WHT17763.1 isocyanide synthase family protein [Crossiella sp. CA-258035]